MNKVRVHTLTSVTWKLSAAPLKCTLYFESKKYSDGTALEVRSTVIKSEGTSSYSPPLVPGLRIECWSKLIELYSSLKYLLNIAY